MTHDEVDAVHACKIERFDDGAGGRADAGHDRIMRAPGDEDAAAVLVTGGAKRSVADQLPCQAKQHDLAGGGGEDHRAGRSGNEFLRIASGRDSVAISPAADRMSAARSQRLGQPLAIGRVRL